MKMIVKVLAENSAQDGFCAEHGLCLYMEHKGKKYLIDSGASGVFSKNASRLNVDLNAIDAAFLSHAHYDHSGGYDTFFEQNKNAKVYLQRSALGRMYYKVTDEGKKYIGIPKGLLEKYADRFEYIDGTANMSEGHFEGIGDEGIYIVAHSLPGIIKRAEHTHMCVAVGDGFAYDDFKHEQTVVFEEDDGLVCFNSCSHSGVDIVIKEVKNAFPDKPIKAYVGGFHLMGASGADSCGYLMEEVTTLAGELMTLTDATFYSGHCTGTIAFKWLKDVMKDRLIAISSGNQFEI